MLAAVIVIAIVEILIFETLIAGILSALLAMAASIMLDGSHRLVVEKLISRGHCGACRYDLDGSMFEDDGCVVCPECGAAWRLGENRELSEK
jgi:hypothetical protein